MKCTDDTRPRIAVLMAVANGMPWLEEQVKTILQQQYVDVSLFINVDSNSVDQSLEWCQALVEKDLRVTLLKSDTSFGSATKNFFHLIRHVDFSKFHYVSLSDQDDIWYHDKLYRACKVLQSGAYLAYSSNVIAWWSDSKKKLLDKAQPSRRWDYLFESGGPGCTYVLSIQLMLRIQKALRYEPRSESIEFHDWFLYAFARAEGVPWFIDAQPSMLYRQHRTNAIGVNKGWSAFVRRFKYVLSGQALEQTILTQKILQQVILKDSLLHIPSDTVGFLKLSLKFRQCRRCFKDQIFFLFFCLFMAIKADKLC